MGKSLPTVHVTDGKTSMVVNEHEFNAGKFKGFELVSDKAKAKSKAKTSKKKASKKAD
jgi:hypothetical protein